MKRLATLLTICGLSLAFSQITHAALVSEWRADTDTPGDDIWEEEIGTDAADDWEFSATASPSAVTGSQTNFSSAYSFSDSLTGKQGAMAQDTTKIVTMEFWIKPTSLEGGDQIFFETGGPIAGVYLGLNDDTLMAGMDADNEEIAQFSHTLAAGDIDDFIQVVFVADRGDQRLYVNPVGGSNISTADASSTVVPKDSDDFWYGTNPAGLGKPNAGVGGGGEDGDLSGTEAFDGQIALISFYDNALSGTDVEASYTSVIPEPSAFALLLGGFATFLLIRRRR